MSEKRSSPYRLYSVRELAALLGVRDDTVRDLVDRGELHSKIVGNKRRIPAMAVEEWLRRDGKGKVA